MHPKRNFGAYRFRPRNLCLYQAHKPPESVQPFKEHKCKRQTGKRISNPPATCRHIHGMCQMTPVSPIIPPCVQPRGVSFRLKCMTAWWLRCVPLTCRRWLSCRKNDNAPASWIESGHLFVLLVYVEFMCCFLTFSH